MMIPLSGFLIFIFWLFGFFFLWKIKYLDSEGDVPPDSGDLSVIIPARNEAHNLQILLKSISGQHCRPGEIIVVDDHSEDNTAGVAAKAGCKVVQCAPLPEDWFGKPWACWQGALSAQKQILLFLDADTSLQPDGIGRLLATLAKQQGLVSVQPFHMMHQFYEQLAAFFNIITMAGLNAFTILKGRIQPIGAFGPCNMCYRKDYFRTGGHRIVRGDIIESLGFGRAFLKSQLPLNCYCGKGAISFRMYPKGFRSMVEGFSKGFGVGAMSTTLATLLLISCWIFGGVHLSIHLLQSMIDKNIPEIIVYGSLNALFIVQIRWMLIRIGNFSIISALFFQIHLLFFITVFILSIVKTFVLRSVKWKGRSLSTKAE